MKYILVCYKPSGEDTCRGCLMESWSSDFEIFKGNDNDATRIAEILGEKMFENTQHIRAPEWEFTLFIDGLEPYDCGDENWADIDNTHNNIFSKAELVCKQKKEEHEKKELAKAKKQFTEFSKQQEERDRAELARLKAQYEQV